MDTVQKALVRSLKRRAARLEDDIGQRMLASPKMADYELMQAGDMAELKDVLKMIRVYDVRADQC